jgi:hypothetical protein
MSISQTDGHTDRQTLQKYSSEPHNINLKKQHKQSFYVICNLTETILLYI